MGKLRLFAMFRAAPKATIISNRILILPKEKNLNQTRGGALGISVRGSDDLFFLENRLILTEKQDILSEI